MVKNWLEMSSDSLSDFAARLGHWDAGDGPLYGRLAAALRRLLENGELRTGASLPPERLLAGALAVSRNTISAAYGELRRDGWVDSRRGSSTTVNSAGYSPVGAHVANGLFATLIRDNPDVIDLTIAVPQAAPIVTEVLSNPAAHIDDPTTLTAGHGYQPRGNPALRESIAAILTGNGLGTTPDELLITTGAQQGISLVARALLRSGDVVGIEEVSYPGAIDAVCNTGSRIVPLPLADLGVDVEALTAVVRRERPRLLYLVPTFHNPTGTALDGVPRKRLARLIAETETTTIDDVTLADLDFDQPAPPPLAALEPEAPVITIGSLSKVFWGGLRIGWVRARPAVISHLAGLKAASDLGGNSPSQTSAVAMLEHYEETRSWRKRQLGESLDALTTALKTRLPEWQWEAPLGGPHLWIRLPETDAAGFTQLALRSGIALVAGPLLAATTGVANDRIRIPYYLPGPELVTAVSCLETAWRSRGRSLDLRN